MKTDRPTSVDFSMLADGFARLRTELLKPKYAERLDKPLAYWALLSDRRLPQAFLGRSLEDLIHTPFEALLATPGVGQKKIASLITLLTRATRDAPPRPNDDLSTNSGNAPSSTTEDPSEFDPAAVSEVLWSRWRETVKRHGIGREVMGRLAPRLTTLPTAIWHTPLDEYVDRTLADIRALKTHGEKRIHAVLEVFFTVHEALSKRGMQDHFEFHLVPKFVAPIEQWITDRLGRDELPTRGEVREKFVEPMLHQLELDAGGHIAQLATSRIGFDGPPETVRLQARRLGVTRARVYQLLEEAAKVMAVRWPEGELRQHLLADKLRMKGADEESLRLLSVTIDLFYPPTAHSATTDMAEEQSLPISSLVTQ